MARTDIAGASTIGASNLVRDGSGPRKLVVGLLSHYFKHANLGCVALSMSNIALMDRAARRANVEVEYRVLLNEKAECVPLGVTDSTWTYRTFPSTRAALVNPISFVRSRVFDGCDLVVNINAGDGFTDIYGLRRLVSEVYMTALAQVKDVPVVLAPQTIGPFTRRMSRAIAFAVLGGSEVIFSRDRLSSAVCESLGVSATSQEVIDVAFSLPYSAPEGPHADNRDIGVNVSGLLYRGGYDRRNYFGLSFDYADFIHDSVRRLLARGNRVHLIAHVLGDSTSLEDDYSACEAVASRCPGAIVAPRFDDPIQAKSYIARMAFFTGARMHSTIAAFSSGVPVVPVGYSDKLGGLFDTLEYPYYLDARGSWSPESASRQLLAWFDRRDELAQAMRAGRALATSRSDSYVLKLAEVFAHSAGT